MYFFVLYYLLTWKPLNYKYLYTTDNCNWH